MQRLAGIFLEVGVVDANTLFAAIGQLNLDPAGTDDGLVELGGLVALGQVGVEVVFALKYRGHADLGVDGEAKHHRVLHCRAVEYRQGAGHCQVDGVGLAVGLGAKGGARCREYFAVGGQLDMHLKADHRLPVTHWQNSSGPRWCQSLLRW